MTTIKQLPEIVNGRIKASVGKVDASLIDLNPVDNALVATTEGLKVDLTNYATIASVANAISEAQLSGNGEVDLSGYATKDDLEAYMPSTEVLEHFQTLITNIPTIIQPSIDTAIANVVDGAPETFNTLKEIADWIENEGVDVVDLTTQLAAKTNQSETDLIKEQMEDILLSMQSLDSQKPSEERVIELYTTYMEEVYNPQFGSNLQIALDTKVDKVDGKDLSTNDFTNDYKEKLDTLDADLSGKLSTPTHTPVASTTPTLDNSLPLYTLSNNGEYVLCTPDTWFLINGFYVPGYSAATLGVTTP